MTYPQGADTDLLKRAVFQAYLDHMDNSNRRVLDGAPELPPVSSRASIDDVVNQVMPPSRETIRAVAAGMFALPDLDANQLQDLAAFIEAGESVNTESATHSFGNVHPV
jgi:hypothetical protein